MEPLAAELRREAHLRILQQLGHDYLARLPRQDIPRVDGAERQRHGAYGQLDDVAARGRPAAQDVGGQLDEGAAVEGVEDDGHGGHGDDERGDGAGGDDPAVGDGHVDAGGESVHDWGAGVEGEGRWWVGWGSGILRWGDR